VTSLQAGLQGRSAFIAAAVSVTGPIDAGAFGAERVVSDADLTSGFIDEAGPVTVGAVRFPSVKFYAA